MYSESMVGVDLSVLLGAVAGAVFGAAANGYVRGREVKQMQTRERRGLLGLIDNEVRYNTTLMATVTDDNATQHVRSLRTDTWDKVMDRLAQLLPNEDLHELTKCYGFVRLLHMSPPLEGQPISQQKRQEIEMVERYDATIIPIVALHKNQGSVARCCGFEKPFLNELHRRWILVQGPL